jgi:hypothetical protein
LSQKKEILSVSFIDFLFTAAILGSVINRGVFSESWITTGYIWPQSSSDLDYLLSFVLSLLVLALSWFGYHNAIIIKPHKGALGMFRFVLDVLLVLLYTFTILNYKYPEAVIQLIVCIFTLYFFWDVFLIIETKNEYIRCFRDNRKCLNLFRCFIYTFRRELVTFFWFILLLLLNHYHYLLSIRASLILGIFFVVMYRINKLYPIWELLFGIHEHMENQKLKIYIAGPYTNETEQIVESNVNKAIDAGIQIYKKGHFPYIPHLTYWVDKRAKDIKQDMAWEDYIVWDMEWLSLCDAILYLGSSKGADIELNEAKNDGKKVYMSVDDIPPFTK